MFSDKTYNNIMAEMMEYMPDGVDTQEGSLLYNACTKMALKLEEQYMEMQYLYENMIPSTMDEEHLIAYAKERGIALKEPTFAILQAEFQQEIPLFSRFSHNDLNYQVIENIKGFTYKIECETAGKIGNTYFGQLAPITFIEDWKGGELIKVLIPGEEAQTIDELREEVLKSFDTKEFGGNKADYKKKINSLQGVGGCKVKRRDRKTGYIDVIILSSEYQVPSEELVETVQTAIDPEVSSGEGDGLAPIGHRVIVKPVEVVPIHLLVEIAYDHSVKTDNEIKRQIESKVSDYFLKLTRGWEKSTFLEIKIYQIISELSSIEGITDIHQIQLNGSRNNFVLQPYQIPEIGEIQQVQLNESIDDKVLQANIAPERGEAYDI